MSGLNWPGRSQGLWPRPLRLPQPRGCRARVPVPRAGVVAALGWPPVPAVGLCALHGPLVAADSSA